MVCSFLKEPIVKTLKVYFQALTEEINHIMRIIDPSREANHIKIAGEFELIAMSLQNMSTEIYVKECVRDTFKGKYNNIK